MPITKEYLRYHDDVEEELRDRHDYFFTNVEYWTDKAGKRVLGGEVDMMGYDEQEDTLYLYELKSSRTKNHRAKGRSQLKRAKRYYEDHGVRIDGSYKSPQDIVLILNMYGPDESGDYGIEKTQINILRSGDKKDKSYRKRKRKSKRK